MNKSTLSPSRFGHEAGRVFIAGVDQRHAVVFSETGLWAGRRDPLGDLDDFGRVSAVRPAGDQNHVGPQLADPLDLFVRQPLVVGGDHVHHNRPGSEGGPLGTGGCHFADDTGDHHLQSAAGTRRGDIDVAAFPVSGGANQLPFFVHQPASGQFADFGGRVDHPHGDVGHRFLDRRGRLAAESLAVNAVDFFDQDGLGRGAATVRGQNDVQIVDVHRITQLARACGPVPRSAGRDSR